MHIVTTVAEMTAYSREAVRPLGLVPTMGALHEGHLTLVRRAKDACKTVVVSIFVNPTQFGPKEDFAAYPRDLPRDMAMLEKVGVDIVYAPTVDQIYPRDFDTWVVPGKVAERLEGEQRPGHFRGVATVVTKLFTVVRPDRAFFGQKDGQQCVVIRRLNMDLNLGIDITIVPTVREPDGLAMSSRNVYLSPEERRAAPVIYRALSQAKALYDGGERDADRLRTTAQGIMTAEPLVKQVDYVSLADFDTLEELTTVDRPALLSTVARIGRVRLLDNVHLGVPS